MPKNQLTNLDGVAIFVALLIVIIISPFILSRIAAAKRDRQRLYDIKQLQSELKSYFVFNNNFPIIPEEMTDGKEIVSSTPLTINKTTFADPLFPKYNYIYQSDQAGKSYTIKFCLETNFQRDYNKGCDNKIVFPSSNQ